MTHMEASHDHEEHGSDCTIVQADPGGATHLVRIADMSDGMLEASLIGISQGASAPDAPPDDDAEDVLTAIVDEQMRRRLH